MDALGTARVLHSMHSFMPLQPMLYLIGPSLTLLHRVALRTGRQCAAASHLHEFQSARFHYAKQAYIQRQEARTPLHRHPDE